jgi:hypothetical protein
LSDLFRVFPSAKDTLPDEPGGALYVPSQGGGRIDNPSAYSVLYVSDSPAGAAAEAFGRFPEWTQSMLDGLPALPGSMRALAQYTLAPRALVCDLDDPARLLALQLRPSDVVSRDYARCREWAMRIYQQKTWVGIRWWSYYNPAWSSLGLWDTRHLRLKSVTLLTLDHPAITEASRAIVRRIIPAPRPTPRKRRSS